MIVGCLGALTHRVRTMVETLHTSLVYAATRQQSEAELTW